MSAVIEPQVKKNPNKNCSNLTSIRRALKNIEAGLEKAGGAGKIYGWDWESNEFLAYADEELTTPLTYQEGKRRIINGAGLIGKMPDEPPFLGAERRMPLHQCFFNENIKVVQASFIGLGEDGITIQYNNVAILFSDTSSIDS